MKNFKVEFEGREIEVVIDQSITDFVASDVDTLSEEIIKERLTEIVMMVMPQTPDAKTVVFTLDSIKDIMMMEHTNDDGEIIH